MIVMAPLSPKAQAVIQSGREGLRPTVAERERIEAVLDASALAPVQAPLPRTSPWRLVASLAVGFALVGGGGLFLARSHTPPPAPAARAPATFATPVMPPAPAASVTAQVEPPLAPPDPVPVPAPSAPADSASGAALPGQAPARAGNGLSQEIALLSRAASALRAGRAAEALQVINEHQRKFPNGVLSVERRAVRAQALCSLKRVAEGRAELARLAHNLPAAARAKQICDAAAGASED